MSDNYSIENQNTDGVNETYSIPNSEASESAVYTIEVPVESEASSNSDSFSEGESALFQTLKLTQEANVYIGITNMTVENGSLVFYCS